ncbi:MAG TPA: sortase [Thermoflexales bacterium]|nr:sortase [Thermoflexales bacterium]
MKRLTIGALMVFGLALSACGGVPAVSAGVSAAVTIYPSPTLAATATPLPPTATAIPPTVTPAPTVTATLPPTPRPTATPIPPTPTPESIKPPTRIVIPSIRLDAPVKSVGLVREPVTGFWTYDIPAFKAAGWSDDSAPLGRPGNTVLNGHNNILGKVFLDLVDVKKGDTIAMYEGDRLFNYKVTDVLFLLEAGQPNSVRIKNASFIKPTDDVRLTIVSCWPRDNNTHRLIVIAKPA